MKVTKVLTVLLAMMLFSFGASAQMVKASFGVTGGGIATMTFGTDPAPSSPLYMSGYGGAFATVNIGSSLGIRGGANYAMQGSRYDVAGADLTASQSYIQIPVSVMWHMRSFISLEAGFYQNILASSSLTEKGNTTVVINPDEGALKYNFGALAGLEFNFGRYVFLELKYHYGLSKSYVIYGKGFPSSFATVGVGFNLISTRKSAF